MAQTTEIKMPGSPPTFVNGALTMMLRTPHLQRVIGRLFALMTVTGAKTGRRYTTPVQYMEHDGEFVVLSQRMRKWWRNISTRPEVEMRVRGADLHGHARIASGDEAHRVLADCLRAKPSVGRFYGLQLREDGTFDTESIGALLERVVVIVVTTQPIVVDLSAADVVLETR